MKKRVLWYQLWDYKTLVTFNWILQSSLGRKWSRLMKADEDWWRLMITAAFSWNVSEVIRSQIWYQRTIFSIYAGEATSSKYSCYCYSQLILHHGHWYFLYPLITRQIVYSWYAQNGMETIYAMYTLTVSWSSPSAYKYLHWFGQCLTNNGAALI